MARKYPEMFGGDSNHSSSSFDPYFSRATSQTVTPAASTPAAMLTTSAPVARFRARLKSRSKLAKELDKDSALSCKLAMLLSSLDRSISKSLDSLLNSPKLAVKSVKSALNPSNSAVNSNSPLASSPSVRFCRLDRSLKRSEALSNL